MAPLFPLPPLLVAYCLVVRFFRVIVSAKQVATEASIILRASSEQAHNEGE